MAKAKSNTIKNQRIVVLGIKFAEKEFKEYLKIRRKAEREAEKLAKRLKAQANAREQTLRRELASARRLRAAARRLGRG